jgi:hypothetical protein
MRSVSLWLLPFAAVCLLLSSQSLHAQTAAIGNIAGTVTDPAGDVVAGAIVKLANPAGAVVGTVQSDAAGEFSFHRLPLNEYRLTVRAPGFGPIERELNLTGNISATLSITLPILQSSTRVRVTASDGSLVQTTPSAQTSVNMSLLKTLPIASGASGLSAAVTLQTPGVVADSNGMFHPLGEHADTTFTIDGQPISDQQSRNFSNQLTAHAVKSIHVINGVIPPQYGNKASIVVKTTTKSGLDDRKPNGEFSVNYGSFGAAAGNAELGLGSEKWGNFLDINGMKSGRLLDAPEFDVMHDRGNNENFFDRIDGVPGANDRFHLDLNAGRTWTQIPNQYDQQFPGKFLPPNPLNPLGLEQDQRQKILTYNIAGTWTHILGPTSLVKVTPFIRQDNAHYYPSRNPFADSPVTLAQSRRLQDVGLTLDYSYIRGIQTVKLGGVFEHTFLDEGFGLGITNATYNAVCVTSNGTPAIAPGIADPNLCVAAGYQPNPNFVPGELPYDLTRGGKMFVFKGHADIKQETLYVEDNIAWKGWKLMMGIRGDNYNGLSSKSMVEPRIGAAYRIPETGTVISGGFGRLMPTPYNENLVLSSSTGLGGLTGGGKARPLTPASRNQYNIQVQQPFGRYVAVTGSYFWKHTKGDYDFDTLLNTPLAFPIQWKKSNITGGGLDISMRPWHGLSAFSVMGHAHALFTPPEIGGLIFNSTTPDLQPFLIDHDQAFQQNTHLEYQPKSNGPWYSFDWRFESGEVAGNVPFGTAPGVPVSLTYLTADQQQQIKLSCNGVGATLTDPLVACLPEHLKSPLVTIPRAGTESADKNPPRVAPRNLFGAAAGWNNVFHRSRYKIDLNVAVTNLTNKVALYNYLSTFSGTHFVSPRQITAKAVLNF